MLSTTTRIHLLGVIVDINPVEIRGEVGAAIHSAEWMADGPASGVTLAYRTTNSTAASAPGSAAPTVHSPVPNSRVRDAVLATDRRPESIGL
ncbi:hypothetical protein HNP40_003925 [Mycobacteroides chelonae]|nr:hypothetical protein [Mycobacteroides chelonae]